MIPPDQMQSYMAKSGGQKGMPKGNPNGEEDDGGMDYADEMADWLEALDEYAPELAEALGMLGDALESGDEETIGKAWELVSTAMEMGNPAYPTLSGDEQKEASRLIKKHVGDYPREQAIAIGLRQAAPEKYKSFDASRG